MKIESIVMKAKEIGEINQMLCSGYIEDKEGKEKSNHNTIKKDIFLAKYPDGTKMYLMVVEGKRTPYLLKNGIKMFDYKKSTYKRVQEDTFITCNTYDEDSNVCGTYKVEVKIFELEILMGFYNSNAELITKRNANELVRAYEELEKLDLASVSYNDGSGHSYTVAYENTSGDKKFVAWLDHKDTDGRGTYLEKLKKHNFKVGQRRVFSIAKRSYC